MKNWRTNATAIIVLAGTAGCIGAFILGKIDANELTTSLAALGLFGITVGLFAAKDAKNP